MYRIRAKMYALICRFFFRFTTNTKFGLIQFNSFKYFSFSLTINMYMLLCKKKTSTCDYFFSIYYGLPPSSQNNFGGQINIENKLLNNIK